MPIATFITSIRDYLRSWGNPEQTFTARDQAIRAYRYQVLWDLYSGNAFANKRTWAEYRRAYSLYRQTRQVWDVVYQLVEFYAHHIWSGALSFDGRTLPDGIPMAVPLAPDTSDELKAAIGQLWQWWNFQTLMTIIPRYTAATGELLVEIIDDPERGKIGLSLVWPAYVRDISLDGMGNVKSYTIEYTAYDRQERRSFLYTRTVDKEKFVTLKDGEPFDFSAPPEPTGQGALQSVIIAGEQATPQRGQIPNPYGFVPAVWFRHHHLLGERGEPAAFAILQQLDEINQLLSHWLDKAHTILESPILVSGATGGTLGSALKSITGIVRRGPTEEDNPDVSERETQKILEGPQGAGVHTMSMPASDAAEIVDRLIANLEAKVPEIQLYRQLRQMTQLTGAGALRALGDVDRKTRAVAAGYDQQLIKLLQMSIAIAGFRVNEGAGGWARQTRQQQKFAMFGLDSYEEGALNFDILPRSIVAEALSERFQTFIMKKTAIPIIPDRELAIEAGYPPDTVDRWIREREQRAREAQAQDNQHQAPASNGQEPSLEERLNLLKAIPGRPGAPPDGPQHGQPVQNRRRGR
jgi:hypothetical protein